MGQQASAVVDDNERPRTSESKVQSSAVRKLAALLLDSPALTPDVAAELLSFRLPPSIGDRWHALLNRYDADRLFADPARPTAAFPRLMRTLASSLAEWNARDNKEAKDDTSRSDDLLNTCLGIYAIGTFLLALLRHCQQTVSSAEVLYLLDYHASVGAPGHDETKICQIPSGLPKDYVSFTYKGVQKVVFRVRGETELKTFRSKLMEWMQKVAPDDSWVFDHAGLFLRNRSSGDFVSVEKAYEDIRKRAGFKNHADAATATACNADGDLSYAMVPLLPVWRSELKSPAASPSIDFLVQCFQFVSSTQRLLLGPVVNEPLARAVTVLLELVVLLTDLAIFSRQSSTNCEDQKVQRIPQGFGGLYQAATQNTPLVEALVAPYLITFQGLYAAVDSRSTSASWTAPVSLSSVCQAFTASLTTGLWLDHPFLCNESVLPMSFEQLVARIPDYHSTSATTASPVLRRLSAAHENLLAAVTMFPLTTPLQVVPIPMQGPANPAIDLHTVEGESGQHSRTVSVVTNHFIRSVTALSDSKHFPAPSDDCSASSVGCFKPSVPVSFDVLLASFSSPDRLKQGLTSLLLYALVYHNRQFRLFVSTRTDIAVFTLAKSAVLYDVANSLATMSAAALNTSAAHSNGNDLGSSGAPWIPLPPVVTLLVLVTVMLTRDPQVATALFRSELSQAPKWITGPLAMQLNKPAKDLFGTSSQSVTVGAVLLSILLKLVSVSLRISLEPFGQLLLAAALTNLSTGVHKLHWAVADQLVDTTRKLLKQNITGLPRCTPVRTDYSTCTHQSLFDSLCKIAQHKGQEMTSPSTETTADEASVRKDSRVVVPAPQLGLALKLNDTPPSAGSWARMRCNFHALRGLLLVLTTVVFKQNSTEVENPHVIYAFLRSESLLSLCSTFVDKYREYNAALDNNRQVQQILSQYQNEVTIWEDYRAGRHLAECNMSQPPSCCHFLPLAVAQHYDRISAEDLPSALHADTSATQVNDDVTMAVRANDVIFQLMPYVQLLQDLSLALLGEVAKDDESVRQVGTSLATIVHNLKQLFQPPPADGAAETAAARKRLYEHWASTARPLRYAYRETPTSCDYFLPLVWKTIAV